MQCEISLPEVTLSSSIKELTERQLQLLNLEGGLLEPKRRLFRKLKQLPGQLALQASLRAFSQGTADPPRPNSRHICRPWQEVMGGRLCSTKNPLNCPPQAALLAPAPDPRTPGGCTPPAPRRAPVVEGAVAHVHNLLGGQVEELTDVARHVQHRALLLRANVVHLAHAALQVQGGEGAAAAHQGVRRRVAIPAGAVAKGRAGHQRANTCADTSAKAGKATAWPATLSSKSPPKPRLPPGTPTSPSETFQNAAQHTLCSTRSKAPARPPQTRRPNFG
jgi:hypothetical protein